MDFVTYVLLGVFAVFVAIMSFRKGNPDKGKDYDQKRDEMYEFYENRMETFKKTEMKGGSSEELEGEASEGPEAASEQPVDDAEEPKGDAEVPEDEVEDSESDASEDE